MENFHSFHGEDDKLELSASINHVTSELETTPRITPEGTKKEYGIIVKDLHPNQHKISDDELSKQAVAENTMSTGNVLKEDDLATSSRICASKSAEEDIILPPEIWDAVFNSNWLGAKDLNNVSHVCETWKNLINPKRTAYLFQLVVPHIAKYLKKKGILPCRLVCKSWKSGVDELLENLSCCKFPPVEYLQAANSSLKIHTTFFSIPILRLFMYNNSKRSETSCPFPSKAVIFCPGFEVEATGRSYFKHSLEIVHKFGSHIRKCALMLPSSSSLVYLEVFLDALPNLRSLIVLGNWHLQNAQLSEEDRQVLMRLPKLPHLERLNFLCPRLHPDVKRALFEKHLDQLTSISGDIRLTGLLFSTYRYKYNSLKLKFIEIDSANVEMFDNLSTANWPLEGLALWRLGCRHNSIPFRSLIRVLNNFADSLVEARLGFNLKGFADNDVLPEQEKCFLCPRMETLSVQLKTLKTPEFLKIVISKCPNLKRLVFTQCSTRKRVRVFALPKLNQVWDLLPKLSSIMFVKRRFTRIVFECYRPV